MEREPCRPAAQLSRMEELAIVTLMQQSVANQISGRPLSATMLHELPRECVCGWPTKSNRGPFCADRGSVTERLTLTMSVCEARVVERTVSARRPPARTHTQDDVSRRWCLGLPASTTDTRAPHKTALARSQWLLFAAPGPLTVLSMHPTGAKRLAPQPLAQPEPEFRGSGENASHKTTTGLH